jgi:hypothetical protein
VNLANDCASAELGLVGDNGVSEVRTSGTFSSPSPSSSPAAAASACPFFLLRKTGTSVNPVKNANFANRTGSLNIPVRLSPSVSAPLEPAEGIASRARRSPIDAVVYDQLAEPAAVVNQNVRQSTPTTPQATFMPDQGTKPIARMMRRRRHTLPPLRGVVGSVMMGVTCSVEVGGAGLRDGGGAESGARAARTRDRGLGKRTAMRGARGRERRYDPSEPVAVMIVRRRTAGRGERSEPTRMFCLSIIFR